MLSNFSFKNNMTKLADATGESQQDRFEKRVKVYFEVLAQHVCDDQLNKATEMILRDPKGRFPSLGMLLEVCRMFPKAQQVRRDVCQYCEGTGVIVAVKEKNRVLFNCNRCQNSRSNYQPWESRLFEQGYLPMVYPSWDENDELQLKGAIFLGIDSLVRKHMSESFRKKVDEYAQGGKTKVSGFASLAESFHAPAQLENERLRLQSLKQDRERDGGCDAR